MKGVNILLKKWNQIMNYYFFHNNSSRNLSCNFTKAKVKISPPTVRNKIMSGPIMARLTG